MYTQKENADWHKSENIKERGHNVTLHINNQNHCLNESGSLRGNGIDFSCFGHGHGKMVACAHKYGDIHIYFKTHSDSLPCSQNLKHVNIRNNVNNIMYMCNNVSCINITQYIVHRLFKTLLILQRKTEIFLYA